MPFLTPRPPYVLAFVLVAALGSCDTKSTTNDATVADVHGDIAADVELFNGCPAITERLANPGDPIDGDTWDTFARGFFETWCNRCHSSTLSGDARNGAPPGRNWDDRASVAMVKTLMRRYVGEINYMPPNEPRPSCADRRRIVRWIDADEP